LFVIVKQFFVISNRTGYRLFTLHITGLNQGKKQYWRWKRVLGTEV